MSGTHFCGGPREGTATARARRGGNVGACRAKVSGRFAYRRRDHEGEEAQQAEELREHG